RSACRIGLIQIWGSERSASALGTGQHPLSHAVTNLVNDPVEASELGWVIHLRLTSQSSGPKPASLRASVGSTEWKQPRSCRRLRHLGQIAHRWTDAHRRALKL